MEDPRCSLVVQMPGWHGMANARVTIFGDVYQLPPDMHERAREVTLPCFLCQSMMSGRCTTFFQFRSATVLRCECLICVWPILNHLQLHQI